MMILYGINVTCDVFLKVVKMSLLAKNNEAKPMTESVKRMYS
jgi:hypothetical protein